MKIIAGLTLTNVGVDGVEVSLKDGVTSSVSAGTHRMLLVFEKNVQGAYYKEMPTYLNVTINGQLIHFLPAAPLPLAVE
ncbi:MAG: hypothetical protein ACQKBW_09000 [Puniceicoccales bacterium]